MIDTSPIVAIIPARYGSTRLPAKPLLDLCGKPMIQHVYERAKAATHVGRVIVATDHKLIADAVASFGGEAVMTPPEIPSGSDRIAHVAASFSDASIIVNVQGDEPLIAPQMIDQAIQPLLDDISILVSTVIKPITSSRELHNPNIVKVVTDATGIALYFSRSVIPFMRDNNSPDTWQQQHRYYKHFGLYVYRKEFLSQYSSWKETPLERAEKLEQLRILEHGYRIKTVTTEYDSVPIDTAEDADHVRKLISARTNVLTL
jgi:3-deoxy-manno-octulosonate cytidylyltransferase (CMP-KDO synthetase)